MLHGQIPFMGDDKEQLNKKKAAKWRPCQCLGLRSAFFLHIALYPNRSVRIVQYNGAG
jgi:hypothetical protein